MIGHTPDKSVDPQLRLNLFGALSATTPTGDDVLPRGRKAQAILCYLALSTDGSASRHKLIELLWGNRWVAQGQASLRQSLIDIRKSLAPVAHLLTIDRHRIKLERESLWIDSLSSRADGLDVGVLRDLPVIERLLETLEGLDPSFDDWIRTIRSSVSQSLACDGTMSRQFRPRKAGAGVENKRRLLISVAPVLRLGNAPVDTTVAPAVTQELVTCLARFRWLGVRFSPERSVSDYRVEGYLISSATGLRIVTRLIDERDEDIVAWTGESQSPLPLLPDAIGRLVEAIVAQLDPEIMAIETRRALVAITPSKDAYACVLRAMALIYRFEEADWREALTLLDQARKLDPHYARAQAVSAKCRIIGIAQGWSSNPRADMQRADAEANQAIGLDPRDSLGLTLAAHIRSFVHHDFDGALAMYERALKYNPSCGLSWGYSALTHAYLGRIDEALKHLDRARSIVIHDPFLSHIDGFRGVIAFFARDWDETVRLCRLELRARPRFDNVRKLLIGALCHAGRFEEAGIEDARLRDGDPSFCWSRHLKTYPFYHSKDRDDLATSLVRAGLMPGAMSLDEGTGQSLGSAKPNPRRAAAVAAAALQQEYIQP